MTINQNAWTGSYFEEFLFSKDRRKELITLLEKHRFRIHYPAGPRRYSDHFIATNNKFDRSGDDLHFIKKNGTVPPKVVYY